MKNCEVPHLIIHFNDSQKVPIYSSYKILSVFWGYSIAAKKHSEKNPQIKKVRSLNELVSESIYKWQILSLEYTHHLSLLKKHKIGLRQ